jgi:hypothetical protein
MMRAHLCEVSGHFAICGLASSITPRSRMIQNWDAMQAGDTPCLRCIRKLHRLRVTDPVPTHLIPKNLT